MSSSIPVKRCTVTDAAPFQDLHGNWLVLPVGDGLVERLSDGLPVRGVTIGSQGPFDLPAAEFDRLVQSGLIVMEDR